MTLNYDLNDKEVVKALEHVCDEVESNSAKVIEDVGKKARDEAEKNAPVLKTSYKGSLDIKGGELKASIVGRFLVNGPRSRYSIVADYPDIRVRGTGAIAMRKSNTQKQKTSQRIYYAMAVEYGTKDQKAQPFLGPVRKKIPRKLNYQMNKVIKKAWEDRIK